MDSFPIKAFFFDLDGTLRLPTPSPSEAFIQIARSLDIQINGQTAKRIKLWAYEFWGQDQIIKGEMERLGPDEFWVYYSGLLLQIVDPAEYDLERAKYISNWFQTSYQPEVHLAPFGYETLSALKQAGFYLGLISNRMAPLHDAVQELGLDEIFDLTLAAGEVGFWKPNPNIFRHALSFFPLLDPDMCVYIGDNYFADAVGASAAGITPILFDPESIYDSIDCHKIHSFQELEPIAQGHIPASWR